ncbi:unnamed protein product [Symbiodinium microadriaticum]|nr:unnamed protein product [Symbiodinium sp. KB8]CAE7867729.1 unnamed protein product [Symbiodinium microadriaticum]
MSRSPSIGAEERNLGTPTRHSRCRTGTPTTGRACAKEVGGCGGAHVSMQCATGISSRTLLLRRSLARVWERGWIGVIGSCL